MPLRLEVLEMPDPPALQAGRPLLLPIDAIEEDPDQPRMEFDDDSLRELAETIERRGVRQPISVRPHPDHPDQRWILNFGARRLRASRLAGKREIPAFVDEAADRYDQVIENEQREGLKPLELAMFVQRRLARGETQTEIARLLGKSQPYIVYVSALIDAPAWLLDIYRYGRCRGVAELYQLRRLHALAADRVEDWLSGRAAITRADVMQLKVEIGEQTAGLANQSEPPPPGVLTSKVETPQATGEPVVGIKPVDTMPTVRASRDPSKSAARRGLFAQRGSDVVEIVVDQAPESNDKVFIRLQPATAPLAVPAASLSLIGFLPVSGS